MNKLEWVTIDGYKCLKVTCATCHTDEGPMYWGYNFGDDCAFETERLGRKNFNDLCDKLFPNGYKFLRKPTACEKDEKWAKKHKNMLGDRLDYCYKVTFEAFVYPIELSDEIENKYGGRYCWDLNQEAVWNELNDLYTKAFGHGLTFLPNVGCFTSTSFEAKWAMEKTGLTWDELRNLDHVI